MWHTTFQSTSLSRGKTFYNYIVTFSDDFQSTSLSRGKTADCLNMPALQELSIHFPLTREDNRRPSQHGLTRSFNPLPSHEGRHFQNTQYRLRHTFNPLPSHEGRHTNGQTTTYTVTFQSTSLSRGKTDSRLAFPTSCAFQSTSLSRGKTLPDAGLERYFFLSIHFPLTREDNIFRYALQDGHLSIHFPLTREDSPYW